MVKVLGGTLFCTTHTEENILLWAFQHISSWENPFTISTGPPMVKQGRRERSIHVYEGKQACCTRCTGYTLRSHCPSTASTKYRERHCVCMHPVWACCRREWQVLRSCRAGAAPRGRLGGAAKDAAWGLARGWSLWCFGSLYSRVGGSVRHSSDSDRSVLCGARHSKHASFRWFNLAQPPISFAMRRSRPCREQRSRDDVAYQGRGARNRRELLPTKCGHDLCTCLTRVRLAYPRLHDVHRECGQVPRARLPPTGPI